MFTNSRHARIHHPPRGIQVACAQLKHQNKDPYAQPSELILFPKLRIYFADFPYLLCSMVQRLLIFGDMNAVMGTDKGCE